VVDTTPPSVSIVSPVPNSTLQDVVTFTGSASDLCTGIASVTVSVREDNGGDGIPVGFEDMLADYSFVTKVWSLSFDSRQLADGYYVVIAKATDGAGNVGSIKVPYSIGNWAVVRLLPSTESNKAGRTMPVKFSLRVAVKGDPNQRFVHNEDLRIRIYKVVDPKDPKKNILLQTSLYGVTATDYRINSVSELYITNFKTESKPANYLAEIWRPTKNFMVGSFTFNTVR
jgi:hypothetical protein